MEHREGETPNSDQWLPRVLRCSKDGKDVKDSTDSGTSPNERTTLLPKPDDGDEHVVGETYDLEDDGKSRVQRIASEFWILLQGSIPVILVRILRKNLLGGSSVGMVCWQ